MCIPHSSGHVGRNNICMATHARTTPILGGDHASNVPAHRVQLRLRLCSTEAVKVVCAEAPLVTKPRKGTILGHPPALRNVRCVNIISEKRA